MVSRWHLLFGLLFLSSCKQFKEGNLNRGITEKFNGVITQSTADSFLSNVRGKKVRTLVINSSGGETIAAMQMAKWVHDNNVDIVVDNTCLSSCANYIFPAGKNKKISNSGIVGWHGGAFQKDFRERVRIVSSLENKRGSGEKLSEGENLLLSDPTSVALHAYLKKSENMQQQLFAKIGTSEYVTRAGQEPVNFRKVWTFKPQIMSLFGICNLEAPADYGSPLYLQNVKVKYGIDVISLPDVDVKSGIEGDQFDSIGHRVNNCSS